MGDYYAYDVPKTIQDDLRLKFNEYDSQTFDHYFSLLYTVYIVPNIFLPLLNGMLTEKVKNFSILI